MTERREERATQLADGHAGSSNGAAAKRREVIGEGVVVLLVEAPMLMVSQKWLQTLYFG